MKYIVAVSGGVDSVALLDMMHRAGGAELIVAHFDHGIRPESIEDAEFVRQLADSYGLPFEHKREVLGESASEELARKRRHAFLEEIAKKHAAKIVTAHHLDDLVETLAINAQRGTGWRGVAAFGKPIARPLLSMEKSDLIDYATRRNLQWRDDRSNASDAYLRNRIRKKTTTLSEATKRELHALQATQSQLRREIDVEVANLIGRGPDYSRYVITHISIPAAIECLRAITKRRLTRPQLERLLHAIKTAPSGAKFEAGMGVTAQFSTRYFRV